LAGTNKLKIIFGKLIKVCPYTLHDDCMPKFEFDAVTCRGSLFTPTSAAERRARTLRFASSSSLRSFRYRIADAAPRKSRILFMAYMPPRILRARMRVLGI
jgi:hypothetical protein